MSGNNGNESVWHELVVQFYSFDEAVTIMKGSGVPLSDKKIMRIHEKYVGFEEALLKVGVQIEEISEGRMMGERLYAIYKDVPVPRNGMVRGDLMGAFADSIHNPYGHLGIVGDGD